MLTWLSSCSSPFHRPLGLLALIAALLVPNLGLAALHAYTVTGSVDGSIEADDFFTTGTVPLEGGANFTMTFILDDAVPVGVSDPTFGIYDAISNVEIDFDSGDFLDTPTGTVVTTTSGGTNHAWDAGANVDVGTSTTIGDVEFEDSNGDPAISFFVGMQFVLFDNTGSMYTQSPPELFAADLGDSTNNLVQLIWEIQGQSGNGPGFMFGSVDTITVPEAGFIPVLSAGVMALAAHARRRKL